MHFIAGRSLSGIPRLGPRSSMHGSARAFKAPEANSQIRWTGRIPCPTDELPYHRKRIPCPRRSKFPAPAESRIWESACNTLELCHELASAVFEPAVNLEKIRCQIPCHREFQCESPTLKTPTTARAPRPPASARHRLPTRPAPQARRAHIRSGRRAAWSASRLPSRPP
jgi:hypothetical protein